MNKTWIAIMCVVLAGCAGSLQSSLQNRSGELLYLHDSAKITEKQDATLAIGSFVIDEVLQPSTTVRKTSGFVLPLLFVNLWKFDYQSSLGYAQIVNDYKQFIRDSFVEELKRSGKFKYVEDRGDIEIDIKIKTITMSAPIYRGGHFLFVMVAWAYGYYISAGPVDVVVKADVVLKKAGNELLGKECQGTFRTGILKGKDFKLEDYTTAMIEGLSLAIKDLNENIVKEIDKI